MTARDRILVLAKERRLLTIILPLLGLIAVGYYVYNNETRAGNLAEEQRDQGDRITRVERIVERPCGDRCRQDIARRVVQMLQMLAPDVAGDSRSRPGSAADDAAPAPAPGSDSPATDDPSSGGGGSPPGGGPDGPGNPDPGDPDPDPPRDPINDVIDDVQDAVDDVRGTACTVTERLLGLCI